MMTAASGAVVGPNGGLIQISAASYTLSAETNNLILSFTSASAVTVTINPGLPVGFSVTVIQDGAGAITFVASSGVTLNNLSSELTSAGQYAQMFLSSVGQDIYVLSGGVSGSGGSGITQLTGDVTAGPGSGSEAATLATVNSNVGSFTLANVTVNAKGLVTAASSGSAAPLVLTGQTSTPGSSAGTLTNAPAVGNPTLWLQISVNGTTYYIPGWT
jgi:hypothetical protein